LDLTGALLPHGDHSPELAPSTWVAPGAFVIGKVHLGEGSSVWYGAVLRGDTEPIRMGATILNGAKIGAGSIVAAGAVVPENREFPPRSLIVGLPAKRAGEVSEEQAGEIERGAREYVERAAAHRQSLGRP
jgi:carbonic anhydrase/acetyltransferase-like protein (isoleucine patch superfamily)